MKDLEKYPIDYSNVHLVWVKCLATEILKDKVIPESPDRGGCTTFKISLHTGIGLTGTKIYKIKQFHYQ